MCTGRVDPAFITRAFSNGTDGVFVGGCWPGECHYTTEGNYHALRMVHLCKKLLETTGINPERLKLEWISASEGIRFAEVMNDFAAKIDSLGPLGGGEGINKDGLKAKLDAVNRMIPYVKLVERERLRVRFATAEEFETFFAGEEAKRIFDELILSKLALSQIMYLLREKSLSTGEICETLGMSASEVSAHLACSARQGLVTFDEDCKRFALAC